MLTDTRSVQNQLTAECFAQLGEVVSVESQRALRDRIVLLNAATARQLARGYHHRGLDADDIDQTAYAALVRSVRWFDADRGHDFLSYAVPSIRGEIKRHFRDQGWVIRVPRRIQETQHELDRLDPLLDPSGRCNDARIDELAHASGRPRADVVDALTARGCFRPASLDVPVIVDDGRRTVADTLAGGPSGWASAVEARVVLGPLVGRLSERDQLIIRMRYVEELTQQEIAGRLGVTQVQVSRLLARIHTRLREQLTDEGAA